jgi:Fem-1 family protein b
MLITQFKPDIEAEGTVIINDTNDSPQIIEGVSPLWAAAAVNNFNIVKFLVEHGPADVNHITKEHSTPLRAACYNGNLKMVQFLIQYGAYPHKLKLNNDTNLMLVVFRQYIDLVIYFVDDIKCDLNQQNVRGTTALHIAVENQSLTITKFLISRGALNLRDISRNITPLMWAAIHGETDFVAAFDGHCSDIEWIEARELLGSAFAGCKLGIENIDVAVEYLTLAFEARATKNIPKPRSAQTLEVFMNHRECETLDDLNQLVSFGSRDAFYIEALLIQHRLLGTNSEDYHNSLRHVGNIFADRNQYDVCLRLWFYELDLRRQDNKRFDKEDLRSFATLFDNMLLFDKAQMFTNELRKLLTIMTDELSSVEDSKTVDYNLVTLLQLLTISAQLLFNEDVENDHKLRVEDGKALIKHIRSIVDKKYVTIASGSSLLHLCCDEDTEALENIVRYVFKFLFFNKQTFFCSYPCIMTVRLLLFCGIDVDAMDSARNTALHILVRNSLTNKSMAIIDFLCNNAGAHIDFADNHGNSPIQDNDIMPHHKREKIQRWRQKLGVRSLKCHCARLAKYGRLPYQNCLSSSLVNFVYRH